MTAEPPWTQQAEDATMPKEMTRYLRIDEVCQLTRVSRTTIWRWTRNGLFPAKRQLGPNSIGWPANEVEAWLEGRPAKGGAQDAARQE